MPNRAACLVIATIAIATPAVLATPDANGYEWAAITHPGNRPTNDAEVPAIPGYRTGSVAYEFRMATTEVTVGQWFEFVQAYSPFYFQQNDTPIASPEFAGSSINAGFDGIYVRPGISVNQATDMSWEYAARYCNWLHNGRVNEAWAFESGAYDTSSFTINDDGSANHQQTRSSGAKYWIPSVDEWNKAAYYDPNRYGHGADRYWLYPDGSDTPLVENLLPEDGGERNGGRSDVFPLDVGSFSHVSSPFGLLDASGGMTEWTETAGKFGSDARFIRGSDFGHLDHSGIVLTLDRLESGFSTSVSFTPYVGLRLASAIECPADLTLPPGILDLADLISYIDLFKIASPVADLAEPFGVLNIFDLAEYLTLFNAGCP